MKYKTQIIAFIIVLVIQIIPVTVSSDIGIPCAKGTANMCGFNDVFVLINNVIKFFLRTILLPLMVVLIMYSGFLFMTSGGNEERRSRAKTVFKNLAIGVLLVLFAWSIVYFVFRAFGVDTDRGRAGLSDKTIDWNTSNAGTVVAQNTTTGSGSGTNNSSTRNVYNATIIANVSRPSATKATVTITPKAPYKMAIRMSCLAKDGNSRVEGENSIASGSNVTTITLNLEEDLDYSCTLENIEGALKLTDPTDGEITTPLLTAKPLFKLTTNEFNVVDNQYISIGYTNASSLASDAAFLYCVDTNTRAGIFSQTGMILDRAKGGDTRYLTYNLPPGFLHTIQSNINTECTLSVYSLTPSNALREETFKVTGTLVSQYKADIIQTTFRISEVNQRTNSVVLVFNGSVNIDPRMMLVCASSGANHIFRARVAFDATQTSPIAGTSNTQRQNQTVNSPISIPVVWNGYGLRPGSTYICELQGQTLQKVAGYPDQAVVSLRDSAVVATPLIPLIKNPESKLMYYVSIRPARVMYVRYPLPRPVSALSDNPIDGPYIAPSTFSQAVPDSMFLPVVNGDVVDNSRMNIYCTSILGASAGTSWMRTVSTSGSQDATNGMSQVYGDNTTGSSYGPGFAIPITRDPQSGFMHSSAYACLAGFTVDRIPQVRAFLVMVPIYVDVRDLGPIVLEAQNIGANNNYAYFTIVASPRLENNVNYTCSNVNGNYTGQVFWPPQALGVRMPVVIPVSSTVPGLKPGLTYNCMLDGVTFKKEKVNYQFIIRTP